METMPGILISHAMQQVCCPFQFLPCSRKCLRERRWGYGGGGIINQASDARVSNPPTDFKNSDTAFGWPASSVGAIVKDLRPDENE